MAIKTEERNMKRIVMIVLGVLVVLAIAAGSFYGGMVYGKNQAQASLPAFGEDVQGMPTGGRGQFGTRPDGQTGMDQGQTVTQGGALFGEIQSIGSGELTITDQNGEQIQIYVTDTTLIEKQAEVTLADLEEGETVVISGSRADDGSITARTLQVSPGGGFFGRPDNSATDGQ
jgi:hypothetical protein